MGIDVTIFLVNLKHLESKGKPDEATTPMIRMIR